MRGGPFQPGADVIVRTLANKRGVVVQVGRGGRVLVRVGRATAWCREGDLDAAVTGRDQRSRPSRPPRAPDDGTVRDSAAPRRIDLHGRTVEDAMALVIAEIDRALTGGADRIEIVHGKGTGRIRTALHRTLASIGAVAAFRLDPKNAGVTWVFF